MSWLLRFTSPGEPAPFQDDRVELGGQRSRSTLVPRRRPAACSRRTRRRRMFPTGLPAHDHLAAGVGVGLEQDGVHPHVGLQAAGLGLHDLGAAHLAAVARDERIERHVLRLERRHANAVLEQNAAQGRRQHALAGVGAGALDHRAPAAPPRLAHVCRRYGRPPTQLARASHKPRVLLLRAHGHAEESAVEMLLRRRTCGWRCPRRSRRSANSPGRHVGRDPTAPAGNSPRRDRRAARANSTSSSVSHSRCWPTRATLRRAYSSSASSAAAACCASTFTDHGST